MSDNLRRIVPSATRLCKPIRLTQGNVARHLHTSLRSSAASVGSKSTQLPTIATKVPDGTKPESRVKRFARWLDTTTFWRGLFLPYADIFAEAFSLPDVGARHGWQCRGPRLCGADDPRDL